MPQNNLPPIIFIRHGETDWNKQGRIQGTHETELNATGLGQAQDLAQALGMMRDQFIGYQYYCSPQQRAQQTMGFIAQSLGVANVTTERRVRELEFGIWEGKPFWELKASPIYPADPEGRYYWVPDGGESYEQGRARIDDWLKDKTDPIFVVAHGAIGRCLIGHVANLSPAQLVSLQTPQGHYCKLENGTYQWFDANHKAA